MKEKRSPTPFKLWVHQLWTENIAERLEFREDPLTMSDYWKKYKYWLKREYRYQQRTNNV